MALRRAIRILFLLGILGLTVLGGIALLFLMILAAPIILLEKLYSWAFEEEGKDL